MAREWPIVIAGGDPRTRGLAYGRQAADRIGRSIEIYEQIFRHYAGLSWSDVRERARSFQAPIDRYDPELVPEMAGIAEGAGVHLVDVLAINVRTEVMFGLGLPVRECTSVVALPEASGDGHTYLAQNWDWKPEVADTVVLLAMAPSGRPAFACVVEAGLVAKAGMSEVGLGVTTNAMTSDRDVGEPGVPFHAIIRRVLTSSSFGDAVNAVISPVRASSANYVLAHRDGEAMDLEVAPGDIEATFRLFAERGVFAHANHFQCDLFPYRDTGLIEGPDSLIRQRRAERSLMRVRGKLGLAEIMETLRDHFDQPRSVCGHRRPEVASIADYVTMASVIMDLTAAELWVSAGPPCTAEFVRYAVGELLGEARAAA